MPFSGSGLSEAQLSEIIEKAIPINTKKVMKFGFGVFQDKVLFLTFYISISQEKQIITSARVYVFKTNNKFAKENSKEWPRVVVILLIHWLIYANEIIHLVTVS